MPSEEKDATQLRQQAGALLKRFYGYDDFRPIQYEAIESVLTGHDTVVLMPTGGGKSVCYQIPALLEEGCTIVVSPLLALMKDQVDTLRSNGIPAAAVNSMQTDSTNRDVIEKVFAGRIKLLYVSPERLLSDIKQWAFMPKVNLIAIDEAHCISQWGHDFRPEYTQLATLKSYFPDIPIMALTATADKLTREDIAKQLGLKDARLFVSSFDRPNLSLNVVSNYTDKEKLEYIADFIENHSGQSGIVYCLSRANTEKVAAYLKQKGYNAACYHAGLSNAERQVVQQRFLNDDVDIICATVAFGMGIDKSNIRWVIHFNMPKNVECYYQEIGRAGRDGLPADTVMFYSYADVAMLSHFVEESGQMEINKEKLRRMQEYAEASVCRRRMLLSYFNERYDHDCGNCDVCRNPPERFDGTRLCQMAVSAILRTKEQIGFNLLIDVLRGVSRPSVTDRGFDKIKTFGVGANLSYAAWNSYLLQMLQMGIFEIAYNERNHLKVTDYGWDIVKGKESVLMSRAVFGKYTAHKKAVTVKKVESPEARFTAELKKIRADLAQAEGTFPYIIFSDKVLDEMRQQLPVTVEEFAALSGVGENKVLRYGKQFLSAIRRFKGLPAAAAGMSESITLYLLNRGYGIEEIAEKRHLRQNTIASHIAKLIQLRRFTDYWRIIDPEEYLKVISANERGGENWSSSLVAAGIDPCLIPVALAIYRLQKTNNV